jgi:Chalcone isomerase-like
MKLFSVLSLVILILLNGVAIASTMIDPATGISFPTHHKNGLEIFGVGVRKKGPIKIYSVACYGNKTVKDGLSSIRRSNTNEKDAYKALHDVILESSDTSFVLEMAFKVGAAKMASAIADSVLPRHKGDKDDIEQLKEMIYQGVSKGNDNAAAVKGTKFQFDCHLQSGMDVTVNGKPIGSIPSPELTKAFCNVYCDNDCVSPALRKSCLEHCIAE